MIDPVAILEKTRNELGMGPDEPNGATGAEQLHQFRLLFVAEVTAAVREDERRAGAI